jgi:hypothetical protein
MATIEWSATFETTPAGNTTRKQGDDRIRELKLAIRERLQKGGHFMQDPGAGFPKDGRHVIGVGDGPGIYKSDATTLLVGYTDTNLELKAGMGLTSVDGIAGSALKANAATNGVYTTAITVGVPATTSVTHNFTSMVLGTPKGAVGVWLSVFFSADTAANDAVDVIVEFDYLNTAVWTATMTFAGLLVPLRTAANKGSVTHSFTKIDPMTTPANGGTVPMRVRIVNNHATSNLAFVDTRFTAIELRR